MNLLLTGGAGAIGSHMVAHLLDETDFNIIIIDSFRHKGYRERLSDVTQSDRLRIYQHDLTAPFSVNLARSIGSIDHILHLAALSDVSYAIENPVHVVNNNIQSTITMLEYARMVRPKTFLYFSTDESYGPVPQGEAHKEGDPHKPSNAYAASKAACEDLCYAWWRSYGVPLIITHTMNNFASMQGATKFPAMVQSQLTKGETISIHGNSKEIGTRFYIHSRVASDAILYILKNLPAHCHRQGYIDEPDRYHIVGERAVDNLELAHMIADLMNLPLKYEMVDFHKDNPAHDIHYGLQDNKLRNHGWKPQYTLEESLEATIKWQQEHPEWI